jgi:lipopolysaccharide/colanic/teichoic acid biosynthesis glycosyltransferase
MFDGELSVLLGQSKVATYTIGGKSKRIFDVLIASITLIVFLPLFAFVVLLLKLPDPGPVIFRHIRVGQGGVASHASNSGQWCLIQTKF